MTIANKQSSLNVLDGLNFFLSTLRAGIAPYTAIYFARQGFNASEIGALIAALMITNALCQLPAGQLVDKYSRRRELMAAAIILVAFATLCMILCHNFFLALFMQVLIGLTAAVIPATLGAISIGLVGHDGIANRAGRNDIFNHAGNVSVAITAGLLGLYYSVDTIFYLIIFLCLVSTLLVLCIKKEDINEDWSKGLLSSAHSMQVKILLTSPGLFAFFLAVFLFHFANSTLLPMVLENVVNVPGTVPDTAQMGVNSLWSSSCIIIAELVMIFSAGLAGRLAGNGRKPLLLACFAFVALRALAFAFIQEPIYLVLAQTLDGLSAGVFGVITLTVTSDLAYGSGRFNLTQGIINMACAVGCATSNYAGGLLVDKLSFHPASLVLMLLAVLGLFFVMIYMPETKDRLPLSSLT